MRRIGDDRALDPRMLAAQGHTPGDRAAPVMANDGELRDAQCIGEQEDIADQLIRRISLDLLRLG